MVAQLSLCCGLSTKTPDVPCPSSGKRYTPALDFGQNAELASQFLSGLRALKDNRVTGPGTCKGVRVTFRRFGTLHPIWTRLKTEALGPKADAGL